MKNEATDAAHQVSDGRDFCGIGRALTHAIKCRSPSHIDEDITESRLYPAAKSAIPSPSPQDRRYRSIFSHMTESTE